MTAPILRPELLMETVEVPVLIDANDLAQLMRCDASTVHRMARTGKFPKPITEPGMKGARWLARDYLTWAKDRTPR